MCSHSFAARKNGAQLFEMTAVQYLKRLDCLYDGPLQLLQPSPDTLENLSGTFKWDEKANSSSASSRGVDFGAQHCVNEDGKSVPPLDAKDHFGPLGKGKKTGRRDARPVNAFHAPSSFCGAAAASSTSSASSSTSSSSSSSSSTSSSSKSSSSAADDKDRKVIDLENLKGKFVLFRRSQHDAQYGGFSLLCAKVVEENGDYENPLSYKLRCTGGASAPKEPWSLLLKRMEIVPRRGPKLGTMELKREEYGCPPAVRYAEQTKNWSTWHMTDKQQQKLVQSAGQKFRTQRTNFSQCYVDFKNPEHGFTVVDLTCSFTGTVSQG